MQGNGFVTDYNIIKSRGLSDANPFFKELLKKPYNGSVRLGTDMLLGTAGTLADVPVFCQHHQQFTCCTFCHRSQS